MRALHPAWRTHTRSCTMALQRALNCEVWELWRKPCSSPDLQLLMSPGYVEEATCFRMRPGTDDRIQQSQLPGFVGHALPCPVLTNCSQLGVWCPLNYNELLITY